MKKNIVFTVLATRQTGEPFNHSYIVGLFSRKKKAQDIATAHEAYRGGKYKCDIIEWEVDGVTVDDFAEPKKEVPRHDDKPYTQYVGRAIKE